MNAFPRYAKDPAKWIGKTVETTGGRRGEVQYAVRNDSNVIELDIATPHGTMIFTSDEHATMVRTRP
jgi:hypothetical protein